MKKFVTIGLGNFGLNLAMTLEKNGCEVLGVDSSRSSVDAAKEYITQAVIADASSRDVLESLKLRDFDAAVVSLGQEMAPSILISLYLKEIGLRRIITRAVSEDHAKILQLIGVNEIIFPEKDAALKLADRLALKNMVDYLPLGEDFGIVEISPPERFKGRTLVELKINTLYKCQVIGIKYPELESTLNGILDEKMSIKIVPSGDDVVSDGCKLVIIGKYSDIAKIEALT